MYRGALAEGGGGGGGRCHLHGVVGGCHTLQSHSLVHSVLVSHYHVPKTGTTFILRPSDLPLLATTTAGGAGGGGGGGIIAGGQ